MRLQDKPLSPLVFKPIPARFRKHLPVLYIVGDGRCLSNALLHSRCAAPPLSSEADRLRSQLRDRLLSSYSTIVRQRRVPPQLSEGSRPQAFVQRFLTDATTYLPPDTICLWQDLMSPSTDVCLLQRSSHGHAHADRVHTLAASGGGALISVPARTLRTHKGLGADS